MFRHSLFCSFIFISISGLWAQTVKNRVISLPAIRNGITLREPWTGGMNAPQFSFCDLNNDGIKDLVVFDREGNKLLTYISNGDGTDSMFHYAPQYEGLFPAGLSQFVLMRDYNHDGIPDIFTFANAYAGIRVFKGSIQNNLLHFDLVCPVIETDTPFIVKVFVNNADMPVITDVNHDGDLDILAYDIFGANVGYYENLTKEHAGDPHYNIDSFKFTQVTSCWGNFTQNPNNNAIALNTSCKGGTGQLQPDSGGSRHAGNSLYSIEDPAYNTVDILNGNVGYNNLIYLQNCGDSSYASICVADSLYPLCDVPVFIATYPAAYGVDVNNDGLEDMLVAPNQTTVELDMNNVAYYKKTSGTNCPYEFVSDSFIVHNMLDFGTDSKALFYDFNGDGLKDIIVGNFGHFRPSAPYLSSLAYYQNTGTATHPEFTMQTNDYNNISVYGLQGVNPAFGDLNGDGKPDLLTGDITGNLSYFQNVADSGSSFPSMTASHYFNLNAGPNSAPFIYDMNGDSLPDLLIGRQDGGIAYYWNFGTKTSPQFSSDSVTLFLGHINVTVSPNSVGYSQPYVKDSSGHLKLFVGSLIGRVFEYDINPDSLRGGRFNLITSDFLRQYIGAKSTISIADINNDGQAEYLIGNSRGGLLIYSDSVWDPGTSLGVTEINNSPAQLQIYPNPAKDYFVCSVDNAEFIKPQIELFNVLGEKVSIDASLNANTFTVNTGTLSNGFYIVRIIDSEKTWTAKLLLQK